MSILNQIAGTVQGGGGSILTLEKIFVKNHKNHDSPISGMNFNLFDPYLDFFFPKITKKLAVKIPNFVIFERFLHAIPQMKGLFT